MSQLIETTVIINNQHGLHARPAGKIVDLACRFPCNIEIGLPSRLVNAKSIMSVMLLAASQGTELTLRIEGENAQEAHDALCHLINNDLE